jgi:hypothetical protein
VLLHPLPSLSGRTSAHAKFKPVRGGCRVRRLPCDFSRYAPILSRRKVFEASAHGYLTIQYCRSPLSGHPIFIRRHGPPAQRSQKHECDERPENAITNKPRSRLSRRRDGFVSVHTAKPCRPHPSTGIQISTPPGRFGWNVAL